ncbi:hypothetical protein QDX25_05120 [Auritidibacter ignavus]|uniref:hypothetical protein n=1 Tax=Auritidibacter ignavus TaxID=678932 RepID=UPI00244AA6EE|nr:hypothetical protein [Auritidibacter ignavus]WGH82535.1 hypothetical protein QDX25_05120 [Auritidibacter ignavus]
MDFSDLTNAEMYELMHQLENELVTRQNREALARDINDVLLTARLNGAAREPADEWTATPPIDEAFALGETTVKDGETFVSQLPINVCTPGHCKTAWKKHDPDTP